MPVSTLLECSLTRNAQGGQYGCDRCWRVATVGNEMDGLMVDTLHGQKQKTFIAHYTCPSYAINEVISALHLGTCAWLNQKRGGRGHVL